MFWLWLNGACTTSSDFFFLLLFLLELSPTLPPPWIVWEPLKSWERTKLGQLIPTGQKHIPYHMMLCPTIKSKGKEEEGVSLWLLFVFPSKNYTCWDPTFQEMAGHLPDNEKQGINSSFCFTFRFASLVKLAVSQPMSSSSLLPFQFSPL